MQHQQPSRALTVPTPFSVAFPTLLRETAETSFGLLEREDQAAAISEAFSGSSFPAALAGAGSSAPTPQTGQHQSDHQLQQAPAVQQQLRQQQLQQSLQRRNGGQPSSVLQNEPFVPAGTDICSLLAQNQRQAQQLAAAPRCVRHTLLLKLHARRVLHCTHTCMYIISWRCFIHAVCTYTVKPTPLT